MSKPAFNNELFEGNKGKVMLELSKTYKGDSRFKLDNRFKDDINIQKLPEKFKEIAEKGVIEKLAKKKKIKKDKPLIIQRFEPGTAQAQSIIKKAEGIKKFQEGLKRHEQKAKKKSAIEKGINKVKKAQQILNQMNNLASSGPAPEKPKFKIEVKGNRKQAFKQADFKLFG